MIIDIERGEKLLNISTEFLFNMKAELRPAAQFVGHTPQGSRIIVSVARGTFEGPRLQGTLLPGGGDWALTRSDGVMEVDVRLTLKTSEDALIYITYRGLLRNASAVFKRRAKGETVDPAELYFRTAIFFETAAEKYSWLNQTLAIGIGQMTPNAVIYDIHAIL